MSISETKAKWTPRHSSRWVQLWKFRGTSTAASLVPQTVKNLHAMPETWVQSLGREDPLEEGMATHFSILAWRIPRTEEAGGLQSMQSQESDMAEPPSTYMHIANCISLFGPIADPTDGAPHTTGIYSHDSGG